MQSINSMERCACETSKDLVCKKEQIKCHNLIKQYEMINIDDVTKESMKEHNPNWLQISNHYYQLLIIGGTGFGKTNYLIII